MSGYRAVAKRRGAYAAMPVLGHRGVTNGTPRSPFCFLYAAMMSGHRAVAKRRSAYAAMPALGPAILPFCFLYAAMMSRYRAVAKRRGAYAAMPRLGMPPFSVFSVFSVRNFFCFYKNLATLKFGVPRRSQKGQRQDRLKFGALAAPRRRSQGVSLCPLCILRVLCAKLRLFFQNPAALKFGVSRKAKDKPD